MVQGRHVRKESLPPPKPLTETELCEGFEDITADYTRTEAIRSYSQSL
jgi:hypothetical protein